MYIIPVKNKKGLIKKCILRFNKKFKIISFLPCIITFCKEEQFNRNNCDANDKIISTVMDFVCDDPDTLKYN